MKAAGVRARLARLKDLIGMLLPFLSLQAAAQLLSAIAGLIVVRGLPIDDFAVYSLVTALQAALSILTDTGVSSALIARAGHLHSDRNRLGELIVSARHIRRFLEAFVLLLLGPLLWIWLHDRSIPALTQVAIAVVLALTLHLQITATIYSAVPLILLNPRDAQLAHLAGAAARIAGIWCVVQIWPAVLPALAANLIGAVFQASLSRFFAARRFRLVANVSRADLRAIRTVVKSQIVNSIYFAFSTQITIWVVGWRGTTHSIAAVGALGRLGAVVALGQTALAMLVVPRLARYAEFSIFCRRYLQVMGLTLAGCSVVAVASLAAPEGFLALLGSQYMSLKEDLPLAICSALTFVVTATLVGMNTAKAWIERAWLAIPPTLLNQAVSLLWLDVSTTRGAILFGWISMLPGIVVNGGIAVVKLRAWHRRELFAGLESGTNR